MGTRLGQSVAGLVLGVALVLALGGGRPAAQSSQPVTISAAPDPLDQAERSVVRVVAISVDENDEIKDVSMGSGFAVADGKVVTNNHVIEGEPGTTLHLFIIPERDSGGKAEPVTLERTDTSADLALINAPQLHAPPLKIAIPLPEKNATVHALGYPGITDEMRNLPVEQILSPAEPYVTQGSIALLSKTAPGGGQYETIFHTAAISSGNSGGPLLDECGRVIGVNAWTDTGRVNADGSVSAPEGQSAAIRSTVLAQFLAPDGVATDQTPCVPPIDAAVEARLSAEDAAIAREASLRADAEAKLVQATERDQNIEVFGLAILGAAVAGLAAFLIIQSQRRGPPPAPAAPAPFPVGGTPSHAPRPGGVALPVLIVGVAGAIVIVAAIAFVVVEFARHGPPAQPASGAASSLAIVAGPPASSASGQPPVQPGAPLIHCSLASATGLPFSPDSIAFSFDSPRACVDGRTGYAKAADGYVRYVVSGMEPLMVRNTISADLRQFTQESFTLSPDLWVRWRQAVSAQRKCDAPIADAASLSAPGSPLAEVLSQTPPQPTTIKHWTCTPG